MHHSRSTGPSGFPSQGKPAAARLRSRDAEWQSRRARVGEDDAAGAKLERKLSGDRIWPSLDAFSRMALASRDGLTASDAVARAHREVAAADWKRVGRLNARTEALRKQLWTVSVKDWLEQHDRGADWDLPEKDELLLERWFNALDVDKSGSVDASEVHKLLQGSGVRISRADIVARFARIGRGANDELDKHSFMRLMRSTDGDFDGDGGGETDRANTELHILTVRRQRMLSDIQEPSLRSRFETVEKLCDSYGLGRRAPKMRGRRLSGDQRGDDCRDIETPNTNEPLPFLSKRPTMMEILHPKSNENQWDREIREGGLGEKGASLRSKAQAAVQVQLQAAQAAQLGRPRKTSAGVFALAAISEAGLRRASVRLSPAVEFDVSAARPQHIMSDGLLGDDIRFRTTPTEGFDSHEGLAASDNSHDLRGSIGGSIGVYSGSGSRGLTQSVSLPALR